MTKIDEIGETLVDKKRMLKQPKAYLKALGDKSYNYYRGELVVMHYILVK